jgi:hypothetical protein
VANGIDLQMKAKKIGLQQQKSKIFPTVIQAVAPLSAIMV